MMKKNKKGLDTKKNKITLEIIMVSLITKSLID